LDTRQPEFEEPTLTERQRIVLKLLIREYVATGRAVGSKTLADQFPVSVSSATLRNEMVELEDYGFVQQPHTSGGRIPTDLGYRYYVHHLMGKPELSSGDQIMIRHQFRQVEAQLDSWIDFAASVLAETAGNVSIVTAPRSTVARLRHFEVISLQPRLALLILVTQESAVRQMMLHLPDDSDQAMLSQITDAMVPVVRGLGAAEVEGRSAGATGLVSYILNQIATGLRGMGSVEHTQVRHSGLENILGQPEFSGAEGHNVLALLRGTSLLGALLPQMTVGDEVQVFIGDENPADALRRFGVVMSTYGIDGEVTGVLGVLGPTRMSYWRSISSVRYMAQLMSDLMEDLYSTS